MNQNRMMDERSKLLERYINGGCLSRFDILLNTFFSDWLFEKNARIISRLFEPQQQSEHSGSRIDIHLKKYDHKVPDVKRMMGYIDKYLSLDLKAAIVHGSLATNEQIPFSDFDALAILKDEVILDPKRLARTAQKLNKARKIMMDFDPLQHHGWFVMMESDLNRYPQAYLPYEILTHSKSLLTEQVLSIDLDIEGHDYGLGFYQLSRTILKQLESEQVPQNLFYLKTLLSRFMLLPALYVQSRDKKGIFKKESFPEAAQDFSEDEWAVMNKISKIRLEWEYNISESSRKRLTRLSPLLKHLGRRNAPKIPEQIKKQITPDLYSEMKHLVLIMQKKLETRS